MQKPDIRSRICKGYTWLVEHPDDPHYREALDLYDSLVDEAEAQGIKEKDCWPVESMPTEEILSLFDKPSAK